MRTDERIDGQSGSRKAIRWRSWRSSLPEGVDGDVLTEALNTAEGLLGLGEDGPLNWLVGPGLERRSSVVYPLRLVSPAGDRMSAYYKTYRRNGPEVERGLLRAGKLTEAFAAATVGEGIVVPRILALRPQALTIVSSAISGRPLESVLGHVLLPHRRRVALEACRRIGRAARLIEQLADPDEPVLDLAQRHRIDRSLERARAFLPADIWRALRSRLLESYERAHSEEPAAYAHGDLSGTNVLLGNDSVGFIDFQWQVRWPGYDVARIGCRIAFDPAVGRRRASHLTGALIGGYGDPELTSSPGWIFYTLRTTLRYAMNASRPSVGRRRRVRRARRQLSAAPSA